MSSPIQSLPQEIVLLLVDYVNYDEQVEWMSCCSDWYNGLLRKYVRKLCLHPGTLEREEKCELLSKLQAVLNHPLEQLSINMEQDCSVQQCFSPLLKKLDYSMDKLFVSEKHLYELTQLPPQSLRIRELHVEKLSYDRSITLDLLTNLDFCCQSRLQSLTIRYFRVLNVQRLTYLHHLCLRGCSVSDVSMLGSIPHLELLSCKGLVDISALNDNDHVVVEEYSDIQDYSQSFTNSRRIKVQAPNIRNFSISRWSKVEDLILAGSLTTVQIPKPPLPFTVKKCILSEGFVSAIDFTITPNHVLNELSLSYNDTITCLEGYGLERVVVIKFYYMSSLQSLEGLGRGRNRKIIISYCNRITDFSPLNHVPIVELKYCKGFTNPLQVRCVPDLTIWSSRTISFTSDLPDSNPFENIHSLTLHNSDSLTELTGLGRIPHLQLDLLRGTDLILRLLQKRKKKLENQRISLVSEWKIDEFTYFNTSRKYSQHLKEFHHQWMQDTFDYYQSHRTWVWVRKQSLCE